VKPDEARELIWLVPTKVFADLLLLLVTLRLTERATRTALLELYVLIGLRHLRYWLAELVSLTALRRTQVKTLLATIHFAFVGCHGNPVYRAVTWIPICISLIWSPVFPTCGRIPWEAPTQGWRFHTLSLYTQQVANH
jgi:hypothetical protein